MEELVIRRGAAEKLRSKYLTRPDVSCSRRDVDERDPLRTSMRQSGYRPRVVEQARLRALEHRAHQNPECTPDFPAVPAPSAKGAQGPRPHSAAASPQNRKRAKCLVLNTQDGTDDDDLAYDVVLVSKDFMVIVGSTEGNWDTENVGGLDFAATKLRSDGTILWRWQVGT